jgi:hypothetical protein
MQAESNMKTKSKYVLAINFSLFAFQAFCHDIPVHWAITANAAESAYNNSGSSMFVMGS